MKHIKTFESFINESTVNSKYLEQIADLVGDTVDIINPNPKVYKDAAGKPIVGGKNYVALDKTVVPVWSVTGPSINPDDVIYMVNLEKQTCLVFTPKEFRIQFKSDPVKPVNESQEVNEASLYASKISGMLMDMADKNWSLLGISSADDLYQDLQIQKKYIDAVKLEIEKLGIEDKLTSFADDIFDDLEADNYHHLNALLAVSGYYGPKWKKQWLKRSEYAFHLL